MSDEEPKGRWVTFTEVIQRVLSFEGRTSRQGAYKRTRKQREDNRIRQEQRRQRQVTRSKRPVP